MGGAPAAVGGFIEEHNPIDDIKDFFSDPKGSVAGQINPLEKGKEDAESGSAASAVLGLNTFGGKKKAPGGGGGPTNPDSSLNLDSASTPTPAAKGDVPEETDNSGPEADPDPDLNPPRTPSANDPSVIEAGNKERKRRGRAATLLTGGQGVTEKATTSRRVLLGY